MKSIKTEYPNRIEYQNEKGEYHRLDGPSVEWNDGGKWWFINGQRHREDGPAIEYQDGYKAWYLNGLKYSKEYWEQKVTKIKLKRILDL